MKERIKKLLKDMVPVFPPISIEELHRTGKTAVHISFDGANIVFKSACLDAPAEVCSTCKGKGELPPTGINCPTCKPYPGKEPYEPDPGQDTRVASGRTHRMLEGVALKIIEERSPYEVVVGTHARHCKEELVPRFMAILQSQWFETRLISHRLARGFNPLRWPEYYLISLCYEVIIDRVSILGVGVSFVPVAGFDTRTAADRVHIDHAVVFRGDSPTRNNYVPEEY